MKQSIEKLNLNIESISLPTINIIGRGNVATHLRKAWEVKFQVNIVNPHTLENISPDALITIIAVKDSVIKDVLEKIPVLSHPVAHTSGTTGIDILENHGFNNYGVLYPMQTFSKDKELDYSVIPTYIEGNNEETEKLLYSLGSAFSKNVKKADSSQRKNLHIAAVFACNFVNHLWTLSADYLEGNNLSFDDFIPLIEETNNKIKYISPQKAQTGPAYREDLNIMAEHLKMLKDSPDLQNIYKLLSDSIISFKKKVSK